MPRSLWRGSGVTSVPIASVCGSAGYQLLLANLFTGVWLLGIGFLVVTVGPVHQIGPVGSRLPGPSWRPGVEGYVVLGLALLGVILVLGFVQPLLPMRCLVPFFGAFGA